MTGVLPPYWASSLPKLGNLLLQGNSLRGTVPESWIDEEGFRPPFTAIIEPGNDGFCGYISPATDHTLLYSHEDGSHGIVTTLGSCAQSQCGLQRQTPVNASAPNLYDIAWSNRVAPVDIAEFNKQYPPSQLRSLGDLVTIPCYLPNDTEPTYLGADAARNQSTWQSTTASGPGGPSFLPVTNDLAALEIPKDCSATAGAPGIWTVRLSQRATVQAVLLYVGAQMSGVKVAVGDNVDGSKNPSCFADSLQFDKPGDGQVILCNGGKGLPGQYISVLADTNVSICKFSVWPFVSNAALGKNAFGSSNGVPPTFAVDGDVNTCAVLDSRAIAGQSGLSAYLTIDLGYEAHVETVVVKRGTSSPTLTGEGSISIRVSDSQVSSAVDNCATDEPIAEDYKPILCRGVGRYLTLFRNLAVPSSMAICEVYIYLAQAPMGFIALPPPVSPSMQPPPPSTPGPPINPAITTSTRTLSVTLRLTGPGLLPWSLSVQQDLVSALSGLWKEEAGVDTVTFATFSEETGSRKLLQVGVVLTELLVRVTNGTAPDVAVYITETVSDGSVNAALETGGLTGVTATLQSLTPFSASPPTPIGPSSAGNLSGGAVAGIIIGSIIGAGLLSLAAWVVYRKQRDRRVFLSKLTTGYNLTVEATKGPPPEVMSFLSEDGNGERPPVSPSATSLLIRSNSGKSRGLHSGGVSELWLVDYKEIEKQKQIGEGSFGKVHLAFWRETTVAVKELAAPGVTTSLDEEFPDAQARESTRRHPLLDSLQREAAMMASLRHPSIVMYLGVSLDPPAVITEYCARGGLNDVLRKARSNPQLASQLDWARRLNMVLDAAKGMLYLHSCSPPIIHRDLKSPNLLVDKHWRVKVCDFNLSRVLEDSAVLSSVAATNPRWLAPEILAGKGYTFASDVFAFGVILWEVLTWTVPWPDHGPWQVVAMITEGRQRPEIPKHSMDSLPGGTFMEMSKYTELMEVCWAQDPAERPSFASIISSLRAMLATETHRVRANGGGGLLGVLDEKSSRGVSMVDSSMGLTEEFGSQ